MKKHILFLLLACATIVSAQTTAQTTAQLTPEQMGGTFYAYHEPETVTPPTAPRGYSLVYVSHYGRHGSRYMTDDERYLWVLRHFDDDRALTKEGRKTKRLLQTVYDDARGQGGQLTTLGAKQHRGIARRMAQRFAPLLTGGITVDAHSSVARRCRKSMEAFTSELQTVVPEARITLTTDSSEMRWMANETEDMSLLKQEPVIVPAMPCHRVIASLFKQPSAVKDSVKLFKELYAIASDLQDVETVRVSLYHLFTHDELAAGYAESCAKMWRQNGTGAESHDIPAQTAANLWGNIVTEADKALADGKPHLTLRFGHDTALYQLLSLLRSTTVTAHGGLNLYDIVPMAANLQMAFYRKNDNSDNNNNSDNDDILVAFWLNEKPMTLDGIPTTRADDGVVFYRWTVLKQRYAHYLETQRWKDRVGRINTLVGTDYAVTRTAGIYGKGSEEHGQTLPAVLAPHGMNFWTPQTRDTERKCIAPYYYPDTLLQGFRASHWIVGGCTQDYGSFTLMPLMGRLRLKPEERASRFRHKEEISHPHYYAVHLPDEHLYAEMTASAGQYNNEETSKGTGGRAAMWRLTPTEDGVMHIVVNPNSDYREGFVAVDTVRNAIYGYNPVHRIYQGWGEKAGFSGWFVVQFQKPIELCGVRDTVAYVSFDVRRGEKVLVRAATSFTGLEGAWRNLHDEMPSWDFLGSRLALDSLWQQQLAAIDVEDDNGNGNSNDNCAKINEFYGALYRASFLPHAISDTDGRHPSFASTDKTTKGETPYYGDYSMWDIYRAQLPLLTITEPQRMEHIMQSLVTKYEEGGWMPIFPCWNSYTAAMIGDHAASALADAWVKGIRGFDIQKAYEGVRKNAFESPASFEEYKDGMGRRALKSYLQYGYIPMEDSVNEAFHTNEQVSRTLEYAYDDFCAAQLAKATGHDADYTALMARSANWRNAINPTTGWADARHKPMPVRTRRRLVKGRDGKPKSDGGLFAGNTDLTHRVPFITEGAVMHYSFYVPHDVDGLMEAMGGREAFIAKLDTLFGFHGGAIPADGDAAAARRAYYWHGNEPCHHIAYLYAMVGEPQKTQWLVDDILRTEYMDVPGGLSGNDDAGQMSAWYVFSSLGFYPVCPGTADYVIGAPQFSRVRIGRLTIETESGEGNSPAGSVLWNGKPYTKPIITHDMITQGGTLKVKRPTKALHEKGSK